MDTLKVKRTSNLATLPYRATEGSVGYDLTSIDQVMVEPHTCKLLSTGLIVEVPVGTYGRIAPRSSIGKKFVAVGAGVIDRDYRGEIKVMLYNHSSVPFQVSIGDRIAQLICERISTPAVVETDFLDDTDRGTGGFGSTGCNVWGS